MLTVNEAHSFILQHAAPIDAVSVPLAEATGRVLAEDIASTVDSPPFDKSMMDGFAVRGDDVVNEGSTLEVIETVPAGQVPSCEIHAGQAARIMTGAQVPSGADTVVPIERTTPSDDRVVINVAMPSGKNILYRGESMKTGETVFQAGHLLRPQDLGVLAELGVARVPVYRKPRVAILATGNELVPPGETPGPGQIRNSNESLLVGLVEAAGCEPVPLGIARDIKEELRAKIDEGLKCDILLLSGGVSAGDLDLVPAVLKEAGVREVFHKVNVKPGKPVWFGRSSGVGKSGVQEGESTLVFGLPGNPVSVLVCFELFARTAIRRLVGREPATPQPLRATLMAPFENRGDRPTYHPAEIIVSDEGVLRATPVRWAGSGDLRATALANGVTVFEPGGSYIQGDVINILMWSGNGVET